MASVADSTIPDLNAIADAPLDVEVAVRRAGASRDEKMSLQQFRSSASAGPIMERAIRRARFIAASTLI